MRCDASIGSNESRVGVSNASTRPRAWITAALTLLALAFSPATGLAESPVRENDLRAAMLVNFAWFTEWPAAVWSDPAAPFVIGVFASSDMEKALDIATRGKLVGMRTLSLQRWPNLEAARLGSRKCQMIYVGDDSDASARVLLREVDGQPVLMVGSGPGFARLGGAIGFIVMDRRLRFEISLRAVERAGLRVSSKLLELARLVDGPRTNP